MRTIQGLIFFYQKLIVPSLMLSIFFSYFFLESNDIYAGIGISFIFLTPMFHYLIYDVKNPNEYYFYHNLGLSKLLLWVSTIIISLIIGLILFII